jgi:hypothetical protein
MNIHVITPQDLKEFQLEHYSEMIEKPRSANHEKYLKHELKRLQNDMDNTGSIGSCNNYKSREVVQKRGERLC